MKAVKPTLIIILILTFSMGVSSLKQIQHRHLRQQIQHQFSPSTSTLLANSIRQKIVDNLGSFTDQQFAKQLKQDLYTDKDEDRKLKQISVKSANQLFEIFDLEDIQCDKDGDGIITGKELLCLNFIWKYYVPRDDSAESHSSLPTPEDIKNNR